MWWLCGADLALPIGDIIYIAGIGVMSVADAVNAYGTDNVILFITQASHAVAEGTQRIVNSIGQITNWVTTQAQNIADNVSSWFKKTFGGGNSSSPGDPDWNGGFKNFYQLKKYLGSAGKGNEWHHIVEQSQIDKSGFDPFNIHNVNNIISISKDVHRQITAYYNSIDPYLSETMRVRDYLTGKSFEFQYEFGFDVLRRFGEIS